MKFFIAVIITFSLFSCTQNTIEIVEKTPWGDETFAIPVFKNNTFNIVDYGAKEDSLFNNQNVIQKAIDACHNSGGGMVIMPKGKWMTSFIVLKSNVNLHLEEGAVLFFLDNIDLYKVPTFTRWEGIECMNYHPLIYARNEKNIAITGKGIIDGNGKKWWGFAKGKREITLSKLYDQVQANVSPEERNCLAYEEGSYLRPALVQFISCENILMQDVEVHSGPMWTNHFVYCTNVVAQNMKVITVGSNNDGFVPDACNKVLIDNCYFSTGDDCVVIKSGLNEDAWRVGKTCENIIVKNCRTKHGNGGIVIGSEMSGGVRNVYGYDCDFSHTNRGLRIKSMKGRGGIVENIWFENIRMDSIVINPIILNMYYGSSSIEPRNDSLPIFRNIHFKNITSTNSKFTVNLTGIANQKIEGIYFENCTLYGRLGIDIVDAQNIRFVNTKIVSTQKEPIMITNSNDIEFSTLHAFANSDTLLRTKGVNEEIIFRASNIETFEVPYFSVDNHADDIVFIQ